LKDLSLWFYINILCFLKTQQRKKMPAGIALSARPKRLLIDTNVVLHNTMIDHWGVKEKEYIETTRTIPDRFQQMEQKLLKKSVRRGDELVANVRKMFHEGFGIKWGDDQIKVFNAFLGSCLPFIYGETWPEEKNRVLKEWKLDREMMYTLVNMARRNGKTYVTSGTAAALLLCVPGIKIAIFSTCKRTSQMMMSATLDMLEAAFERGTHVSRQDYIVVTKNMESVCFEGPDRTKRILGSFPGSVRVSFFCFFSAVIVVCRRRSSTPLKGKSIRFFFILGSKKIDSAKYIWQ
jgi:hypothetical protein